MVRAKKVAKKPLNEDMKSQKAKARKLNSTRKFNAMIERMLREREETSPPRPPIVMNDFDRDAYLAEMSEAARKRWERKQDKLNAKELLNNQTTQSGGNENE